ncbi:MAG: hypothetical protein LBL41_01455 [Bifidobacteriaceae bacterium]|jgi:hypothetical protein|nr:hypothetical protein [Bifidobacteriaceae bacterium]
MYTNEKTLAIKDDTHKTSRQNFFNAKTIRKIYYVDQTDWDYNDFGQLDAYFNRLAYYESDDTVSKERSARYKKELQEMDLSKMSETTKVILCCNISYYNNLEDMISKYSNLKDLLNVKPLMPTVSLTGSPKELYMAYANYGLAKDYFSTFTIVHGAEF